MKYYKVVNKEMKSAIVHGNKDLSIQYKVGEFVEGKFGSGIFVFNSLGNAKRFMDGLNWNSVVGSTFSLSANYHIYEVETKDLVKTVFRVLSLAAFFTYGPCSIIKILKLRKNKKKYLHLMNKYDIPPRGTKCFKQIKLIKRVP